LVRRTVLFLAFLLSFCALAPAQMSSSSVKEITAWPKGTVNISDGWRFQLGDDPAYAKPDFDDSHWRVVSLRARPPLAGPGMRWYRFHLKLPTARPPMGVRLVAPKNGYEVFLNGKLAEGRIGPTLALYGPMSHSVLLPDGVSDVVLAVRCMDSPNLAVQENAESLSNVLIGPWPVVQVFTAEHELGIFAAEASSIAIDIAVCFGGLAVLCLFLVQRTRREYLWLSAYLLILGLSDLGWCLGSGLLPMWANAFFADPLCFIVPLLQVEFTYAFAGKRVGKGWRIYEGVLVAFFFFGFFVNWFGLIPGIYQALQALLFLPAAILVEALLIFWFRRGHREAGWLVFPSLFPCLGGALFDGWYVVSVVLRSHRVDFLVPILQFQAGYLVFRTQAIADLLFLLAIGVVLFRRHTKLTQEQERSAAELQAAREIQERLVPMELPEIEGCHVRAAYVPAAEVGGDFFQVLQHEDGSTLIAVGDVSGKGLRAAMTGSLTIGALRTLADEGMSPAKLLRALNRQLVQAGQGGFVTLLCARLSPDGVLTLANAGHLFPYRNGAEVALETGMPLGISMAVDYAETALRLDVGDSITFLSDGVVEARRADGELFGFERTQAISGQSPEEIADAAQEFGQEDDITVLNLTLVGVGVLA
jgi:phosphoserine phosphatase RsbU/P